MTHLHTLNSVPVVLGHHIIIWTPTIGEELVCQREVGNIYDLVHAVAILRALLMNQKNLIAIMQHFISVTS